MTPEQEREYMDAMSRLDLIEAKGFAVILLAAIVAAMVIACV